MGAVIAVVNQKGGVGKTTLTRELAGACAVAGAQVLMVDCDPQHDLTKSFVGDGALARTLADVLVTPRSEVGGGAMGLPHRAASARVSLTETIIETAVPGLDLVPAAIELGNFEREPDAAMLRLKAQIDRVRPLYDLIFFDCPPQISRLQTEALRAADFVLVPCAALALGLDGLGSLAYTIGEIRENANPNLEVLGVVVNLYKPRRALAAEARERVREAGEEFLGEIFASTLNDLKEIAEAPTAQLPVVITARNSLASQQVSALAAEFLARLEARGVVVAPREVPAAASAEAFRVAEAES